MYDPSGLDKALTAFPDVTTELTDIECGTYCFDSEFDCFAGPALRLSLLDSDLVLVALWSDSHSKIPAYPVGTCQIYVVPEAEGFQSRLHGWFTGAQRVGGRPFGIGPDFLNLEHRDEWDSYLDALRTTGDSVLVELSLARSKGFEAKAELRIGPTKTRRGKRPIEIGIAGIGLLRKTRANQASERLRAGDQWIDEGLVFPTSFGKKCDPRNVYRAVATAAKKAGLLEGSPHTFRHSVISQFLEGDYLSDHKISRTMGHSSVSITTETYGHYKSLGEDKAFDRWAKDIGIA